MLKVITVCGMGVGSSLILKMTVESALSQLGHKHDVEHWDMGTVKGKVCDFIVTTDSFKAGFEDTPNVIYVKNIMDVNEAKNAIELFLSK